MTGMRDRYVITAQSDSTLLTSITIDIFVTGCLSSSHMRTVSLSQLMIDVLGCGDAKEKVRQTVTVSKLTGKMGARHGLGRYVLRWTCRPARAW